MSFVQNNWLLILIMLASGAMLLWPLVQRRLSPTTDIGTAEATRLINSSNALVLDLRETAEYDGGRLPHSVHIPLSQLASRSDELQRATSRPVLAYSSNDHRSRMAAKTLARAGFRQIYNLRGGYRAWKDAGLPVEK
jgi:rhodanese-related sulfurtransferase